MLAQILMRKYKIKKAVAHVALNDCKIERAHEINKILFFLQQIKSETSY